MPEIVNLFSCGDYWVTNEDLRQKLLEVGAADCDTLFMHTELSFGIPNPKLKRKELLQALSDVLLSLNVRRLILPTFTYSFANHEDYDVRSSKTSMGVLLEYMRKLPQAVFRTSDPLMSVAVLGEYNGEFEDLPHRSLGEDTVFDRLHKQGGTKFLIFGGELGESLSFLHHVEKMREVPYRYDQSFSGTIVEADGRSHEETWSIHTACGGVMPRNFYNFEDELVARGFVQRVQVGNSKISCIREEDAWVAINEKLQENINYFLEQPFTEQDLTHEYKYGKNGERVTHC